MRHLADDTVSGEVFLNNDDRGNTGPNGKTSLSSQEAGAQLGRANQTWNGFGEGVLGREATVSFAFRNAAPAQMSSDTSGFSRFSATQIEQTLLALRSWSDVANIDFVRAGTGTYSDSAAMLFGNYSAGANGAAAFAYLPNVRNPNGVPGDSWYNSTLSYNAEPQHLNYGRLVLTHEIGHAIGILHPGDYNAGQGRPTYANSAPYFEDSLQYSVMSYWNERNTGADFKGFYSSGPLMDDISAAQRLYGANTTTRTGNDTYGFNSTTGIDYYTANDAQAPLIFSVWDAGGYDTFDFSGYRQNQLIDLRDGAFSNVGGLVGNVSIAPGVVIERAIGGAGNDTIVGNGVSNVLIGGAGDDRLYSGPGGSMNVLDGGTGHDTAIMALDLSDYARGFNAASNPVLHATKGPAGASELRQIDRYEFADGGFDIDRGNDLFDSFFYMQSNADVYASGSGALAHYLAYGSAEGRDPSAYFDSSLYVALYGSEIASGQSALDHYRSEGAARGFAPSVVFDAERYLEIHVDVAAAGTDALSHYMAFGRAEGRATVAAFERGPADDGFDELFYLVTNADVAVAGVDARQHYVEFGSRENRDPNGIFDTAFYLGANEDVAAAKVDPLAHYHQFGWREGRDPSSTFDTAARLPSPQVARVFSDGDPVVDFLRSADGIKFSSADPYFV